MHFTTAFTAILAAAAATVSALPSATPDRLESRQCTPSSGNLPSSQLAWYVGLGTFPFQGFSLSNNGPTGLYSMLVSFKTDPKKAGPCSLKFSFPTGQGGWFSGQDYTQIRVRRLAGKITTSPRVYTKTFETTIDRTQNKVGEKTVYYISDEACDREMNYEVDLVNAGQSISFMPRKNIVKGKHLGLVMTQGSC